MSRWRLDPVSGGIHVRRMIPEALIHKTASRLVAEHGSGAMKEADRLLSRALERRETDQALVMLRVRTAVAALQQPVKGPLH